jgi:two-component system, chemotaxis family, protein-glutamate methylesterase/glutaminase
MRNKESTGKTIRPKYQAVVIGVSSGGINALSVICKSLPVSFRLPIIVVQHMSARYENYLTVILQKQTKLKVKEVDEKEVVRKGIIYIAPPNYHLLLEGDKTFSLSVDEHVCFSRPSVDVLFETAASVYRDKLIGIILTGANKDGAEGLRSIKESGGLTIVQNPKTADVANMPTAAIERAHPDYILNIDEIGPLLSKINSY